MELEDIFFAKFADLTADGLFTVVGGGVNRLYADSFPYVWDMLHLLVRIRLTREEAQGEHTVAIDRRTPAGQVETVEGTEWPMMQVPPTAELGPDGKLGVNFNVRLVILAFPEAGVYTYRFKVNGNEVGAADLLVTNNVQEGEQP